MQTTICALSTAPGMGAIALIRVSGPNALAIATTISGKPFAEFASHTTHFARIRRADKSVIDEVVITVFHEGKSFTGEATIEIGCHGSTFIQQEILRLLLQSNCAAGAKVKTLLAGKGLKSASPMPKSKAFKS